jgi:hypothetical protein
LDASTQTASDSFRAPSAKAFTIVSPIKELPRRISASFDGIPTDVQETSPQRMLLFTDFDKLRESTSPKSEEKFKLAATISAVTTDDANPFACLTSTESPSEEDMFSVLSSALNGDGDLENAEGTVAHPTDEDFEILEPRRKMSLAGFSPFDEKEELQDNAFNEDANEKQYQQKDFTLDKKDVTGEENNNEEEEDEDGNVYQLSRRPRPIASPASRRASLAQAPMGSPLLNRTLRQRMHKQLLEAMKKETPQSDAPPSPVSRLFQKESFADVSEYSASESEYATSDMTTDYDTDDIGSVISAADFAERSRVSSAATKKSASSARMTALQTLVMMLTIPAVFLSAVWYFEIGSRIEYCGGQTFEFSGKMYKLIRKYDMADWVSLCVPCPVNAACQGADVLQCTGDNMVLIKEGGSIADFLGPLSHYVGVGTQCKSIHAINEMYVADDNKNSMTTPAVVSVQQPSYYRTDATDKPQATPLSTSRRLQIRLGQLKVAMHRFAEATYNATNSAGYVVAERVNAAAEKNDWGRDAFEKFMLHFTTRTTEIQQKSMEYAILISDKATQVWVAAFEKGIAILNEPYASANEILELLSKASVNIRNIIGAFPKFVNRVMRHIMTKAVAKPEDLIATGIALVSIALLFVTAFVANYMQAKFEVTDDQNDSTSIGFLSGHKRDHEELMIAKEAVQEVLETLCEKTAKYLERGGKPGGLTIPADQVKDMLFPVMGRRERRISRAGLPVLSDDGTASDSESLMIVGDVRERIWKMVRTGVLERETVQEKKLDGVTVWEWVGEGEAK